MYGRVTTLCQATYTPCSTSGAKHVNEYITSPGLELIIQSLSKATCVGIILFTKRCIFGFKRTNHSRVTSE